MGSIDEKTGGQKSGWTVIYLNKYIHSIQFSWGLWWLNGGCGGSVVERQATYPVVPVQIPGNPYSTKKFPGYCKVAG